MLGLSFVEMALTRKIFCNSITCEYWQLRLQIIALQEDGFQLENKVDGHKDDQQNIKDEVFNISSCNSGIQVQTFDVFFYNSAKC